MGTIEKNKNLFVVTLDNGKQTYFDFADGQIYGVSGKVIKNFSGEAKKVLKNAQDNDFLAKYFIERGLSWSSVGNIKNWSTAMVETIYSLFAQQYSVSTLNAIANFCYSYNYTLDKKGIKILKEALQILNVNRDNPRYIDTYDIKERVNAVYYAEYPQIIIELISHASNQKMREIILKDAKKITFHFEHENWDCLEKSTWKSNSIFTYIERYIQLCDTLNKERTYKNLYLSLCQLEKEKDLMADSLCGDYQNKAPLFFEDDNFTMIIPTKAEEFQKEADYQQNCVFRLYYPKVKDFETHIVFIRKKDDVNTPYITCEVANNGNIIQYLTRFNKRVTDENALEFQKKYQEFLHKNF